MAGRNFAVSSKDAKNAFAECADGELGVKPGCEALQGTTGAVDIIQDVYHPAANSWLQLVKSPDFLVRDPVSEETLHLPITSFAHDVGKGKLFKDGQDLQHPVLAENMALTDSLQRICTAQGTGKQEHTVSMRGRVGGHAAHLHGGVFDRTSGHEHQIFGELASS